MAHDSRLSLRRCSAFSRALLVFDELRPDACADALLSFLNFARLTYFCLASALSAQVGAGIYTAVHANYLDWGGWLDRPDGALFV